MTEGEAAELERALAAANPRADVSVEAESDGATVVVVGRGGASWFHIGDGASVLLMILLAGFPD